MNGHTESLQNLGFFLGHDFFKIPNSESGFLRLEAQLLLDRRYEVAVAALSILWLNSLVVIQGLCIRYLLYRWGACQIWLT